MTLDSKDQELIEQINRNAIPKWLVPTLASFAGSLVLMGLWAGSIDADLNDLKKYKDQTQPTIQENAATLREIRTDLKYIRQQVENNGFQIQKMDGEFGAYKDEASKDLQNFYRDNKK